MLSVYLDSQDYSVLSDANLSPALQEVKSQLLAHAASGEVSFFFSSVAVCEAAPIESAAVPYAIRRGDLLSTLCARNALIDAGELMRQEIRALLTSGGVAVQPVAVDGNWFPPIDLGEPTPLFDLLKRDIEERGVALGMTRQQRRAMQRKAFKKGRPRRPLQELIDAPGAGAEAICAKFPMKPELADRLARYVAGKGAKQDAEEALRESMRDPCWLMRWFSENPDMAPQITEIVRRPARAMGAQSRAFVLAAADLKAEAERFGVAGAEDLLSRTKWQARTDLMIRELIQRIAVHEGEASRGAVSTADVAKLCPGLDAVVRSQAMSVWDNVGGSRKELPSDSQFTDSLHAIYAPYVDIFRADAFMAPHIQSQVKRHGTLVVQRLTQLPDEIERRLSAGR